MQGVDPGVSGMATELIEGAILSRQRVEELNSELLREIDRRRSYEAQLRESEERFRGLVESYAQAVWETDADGSVVIDSPSWRSFTGQTFEEFAGTGFTSVIHPDDRERATQQWREAIRAERTVDAEFRLWHAAESGWRWTNVRATALRDTAGRIVKWVGMNIDIHDRKMAEAMVERSQNELSTLIERAPFGIYIVDSNFKIALVNSGSQEKAFRNVLPAVGHDFADAMRILWPADVAEDVIEKFRHTLDTGEPYFSKDYIYPRADIDQVEAYEWEIHQITLPDGKHGVVCYYFESTELRQTELALRETTAKFRSVFNQSAIFGGIADLDGILLEANDLAVTACGCTREFVIGQPLWKAAWWGGDPHVQARIREATKIAREGRVFREELSYWRAEGGESTMDFAMHPIRDESGNVIFLHPTGVDVTERKRAYDRLRDSEQRLSLLTESFEDFAIVTMDVDGWVMTWNPGAEIIFGYTEAEMIGQNARILFVPEDQEKGEPEEEMAKARTAGRCADERWHLRKNGSRLYASGIMVPMYKGEVLIGYAKIARDLTRDKRLQEELRRQHEALEAIVAGRTAELAEANEALREEMGQRARIEAERFSLLQKLVTGQEDERRRIARDMHDSLGQQLTALRLKLASIKTGPYSDGKLGENLGRLQELGKRIDEEVNFLVWELRPTVLDDLGLVAAIENYVREWSRHYGIPAEFHAGRLAVDRFPPDTETNLYRITQEALNNTAKHAKARNANVVIESRKNEVILVIEDDGAGFNTDGVRPSPEESRGLGLVGMHERAAIIGGRVEIESSPGKGTTVFVRAPITRRD